MRRRTICAARAPGPQPSGSSRLAKIPRRGIAAFVAAAALGAALFPRGEADAQAVVVSVAHFAGAQSDKKSVPELVLFNTTAAPMTLDLRLHAPDGSVLADRAGEIELGARQTVFVGLAEQLARDLPEGTKPYRGSFSVVVSGAEPFSESTVVAHVAQYFGTRKSPKAAYVLRPLFLTQ